MTPRSCGARPQSIPLGANTCYRRIRLAPAADGAADRTVICYKTDVEQDPMYSADPALATTDYRLPPAPDPESSLTGVIYQARRRVPEITRSNSTPTRCLKDWPFRSSAAVIKAPSRIKGPGQIAPRVPRHL